MTLALFLLLGIALLYVGGELLVAGSSSLAINAGLTPLVVGLTVVSFGTSAPELVVSVGAALSGKPDISIGNVVGSNICNIGLILASAALLKPISVQVKMIRIDLPILVLVSVLLIWFLSDGQVQRTEGIALILGMLIFLWLTLQLAPRDKNEQATKSPTFTMKKSLGSIAVGLVFLILGGNLFVGSAIELARLFSVSEAVIGITIVALGTSLPELTTSLIAAYRGESDIAIGNVVGSNIFNILGVLGVSATLAPLSVAAITRVDLAVMLLLSVAIVPLCRSGWSLSRTEGAVLLTAYLAYIVVVI